MSKITVIGAGYVGLTTAACLASKKNSVTVVEKNKNKIDLINQGKIPFYEPELAEIVLQGIKEKNLTFTTDIEKTLTEKPEFIFSCVNTPPQPDGSADLSAVYAVATEVGKNLLDETIFLNKSTVPVGTTKKTELIIKRELRKRNAQITFDVASNPEFLQEGSAVRNCLHPERIIVGAKSKETLNKIFDLFKPFIQKKEQFISMNVESAELTKYAANSMLAMRISFMNQLALLADKVGANIDEIKKGIASDHRIGNKFLNAGIGYGGSCFSKDIKALCFLGELKKTPLPLFEEIERANDRQREWFVQKVIDFYKNKIKNKRIGIWGLSFKPNTNDLRHAPSIEIVTQLLKKGATVIAYDPVVKAKEVTHLFPRNFQTTDTSREVLEKADCLLMLTEWDEFLSYKPSDFLTLTDKVLFDGRNCFDPKAVNKAGVEYISVGRNGGKRTLLVIPSDPIHLYEKAGIDWLEDYYNPQKYFDTVIAFSPYERGIRKKYGMKIVGDDKKNFSKILNETNPDIIRAYSGYWPSEVACRHKTHDKPIVVSVHDTNKQLLSPEVKKADIVICMSKAVAQICKEIGVKESKIRILPNRVDRSIFHRKTEFSEIKKIVQKVPKQKTILHVGRKTEQKNIDTVVRAIALLPKEYVAVFIGAGDTKPFKEIAKKEMIEDRCIWIESVKNSDLPMWYSMCDCMCTPSRWEGFGIVFIEAAACQSAIITSNIEPMNEYLTHMESAFLVDNYESPKEIAFAIKEVCENDKLSGKLKNEALKIIARFDKKVIDEEEVKIYQEALLLKKENGKNKWEFLKEKLGLQRHKRPFGG